MAGRPALPDDQRRDRTLGVSVTEGELARYHAAARERGQRLAHLVRDALEAYLSKGGDE